uniref:Uncharacterized protein n=1 Tax=Octopus bimaculoides TaxID=37653 RepID=A0A0L8GUP8_OCTBM
MKGWRKTPLPPSVSVITSSSSFSPHLTVPTFFFNLIFKWGVSFVFMQPYLRTHIFAKTCTNTYAVHCRKQTDRQTHTHRRACTHTHLLEPTRTLHSGLNKTV